MRHRTESAERHVSRYYTPRKRYSEALKRKIVSEIERGLFTKESASRHYQIRGHSTVAKWCRRYSSYHLTGVNVEVVMTSESGNDTSRERLKQAEQRIRDLEKAVASMALEREALLELLRIGKEKYGIDLKKKSGDLPSNE